jgi:DNA-binding transcriptional LysR family regulator
MELRHLRYFIAVAELRSVRAASEQLHVTQPAISRQIQDLEDAIGAALFERTPRGLKLTPAGDAYLSEAREILARVDAANRLARRIASGVQGHLRIGFVENAVWSGIVSRALSAFEQAAPNVALELTPMNTPEQLDALAAGRLDGGFCYRFGALPEGIASLHVLDQKVVLAVPEEWPHGSAGAVSAHELAGRPFIAFPRRVYPAYYDRLLSAWPNAGSRSISDRRRRRKRRSFRWFRRGWVRPSSMPRIATGRPRECASSTCATWRFPCHSNSASSHMRRRTKRIPR